MRALLLPALLFLFACHDTDKLKQCKNPGETEVKGSCITPPSCASLAESCGADHDDNCCASVRMEPQEFAIGTDSAGDTQSGDKIVGYQTSRKNVQLSPYYLDRYEVTVGRFRKFVAAYDGWHTAAPQNRAGRNPARGEADAPDGGAPPDAWLIAWNRNDEWVPASSQQLTSRINRGCDVSNGTAAVKGTWTDQPANNESKAITCLTWFEAFMFCIWDGARLPTEAEWNHAAAAGPQLRPFPWSTSSSDTTVDPTFANYAGATGEIRDVGSFPKGAGFFSHQDLAGNAFEWVMDQPTDIAQYGPEVNNPLDVSGVSRLAPTRILRGGSIRFGPSRLRTSWRESLEAVQRFGDVGMRCARPAAGAD